MRAVSWDRAGGPVGSEHGLARFSKISPPIPLSAVSSPSPLDATGGENYDEEYTLRHPCQRKAVRISVPETTFGAHLCTQGFAQPSLAQGPLNHATSKFKSARRVGKGECLDGSIQPQSPTTANFSKR